MRPKSIVRTTAPKRFSRQRGRKRIRYAIAQGKNDQKTEEGDANRSGRPTANDNHPGFGEEVRASRPIIRGRCSPSHAATLDEHSNAEDQPAQECHSISGQMCQRVGEEQVVTTLGIRGPNGAGNSKPLALAS